MSDGKYVDGSWFFYAPNKGAPVFFAAAFAISCAVHIWQIIHYKCFKLTVLYPFCCLLFTAGFVVREVGAFHYDNLNVFIASVCLIYASPPLLELANYHILGRILYYVPYHSPLHPGRVFSTFAFLSGIVEALNGWGASYSANQGLPPSQQEIGHNLMKASLLIQIFVAVSFVTLAVWFHVRCTQHNIRSRRVQAPLHTLYVSMGIITVRTIYRIVEYFGVASLRYGPGFDPSTISPVIRYEWFFYVFEAALMLINVVMFNVRHPRRYLPLSNKIYLAQDGVTEIEGPGWEDKRPWYITFLDPFDLWGAVKGKQSQQSHKFWENNGFDGATSNGSAAPKEEGKVQTV